MEGSIEARQAALRNSELAFAALVQNSSVCRNAGAGY